MIVGDILLDREVLGTVDRLCPEAPVPVLAQRRCFDRPGGAGLAALFAVASDPSRSGAPGAQRPWSEVILLGAVADDEAGDRLRELFKLAGVALVEMPLLGGTPEKIRLRSGEHLLLRLDRGGEPTGVGDPSPQALDAVYEAGSVLVSDYGRGVAAHPAVRRALSSRAGDVAMVWDPHPKGGRPVPGVDLVTPNRAEAAALLARLDPPHGSSASRAGSGSGSAPRAGSGSGSASRAGSGSGSAPRAGSASRAGLGSGAASAAADGAATLRRYWEARAVAVTLGDRGAVLSCDDGPPQEVPAPVTAVGDPCGAGDRLACAAVAALAAGASLPTAVTAAVTAATEYVAAGGAVALLPNGVPVGS